MIYKNDNYLPHFKRGDYKITILDDKKEMQAISQYCL